MRVSSLSAVIVCQSRIGCDMLYTNYIIITTPLSTLIHCIQYSIRIFCVIFVKNCTERSSVYAFFPHLNSEFSSPSTSPSTLFPFVFLSSSYLLSSYSLLYQLLYYTHVFYISTLLLLSLSFPSLLFLSHILSSLPLLTLSSPHHISFFHFTFFHFIFFLFTLSLSLNIPG